MGSEPGAYQSPTIFTFSVAPNQTDNAELPAPARTCSVRGCSLLVEPDSTNKMCLSCRGKHRIYATTKRARRKLEKAAVLGHTIIPVEQIPGSAAWMPGATLSQEKENKQTKRKDKEDQQDVDIPPRQPQTYSFQNDCPPRPATPIAIETGWDPCALDPRLFKPHSTSSELAGALIFPEQTIGYISSTSQSTPSSSTDTPQRPPNEQDQEPNIESLSSDPADAADTTIGPRFCSVKGCKAVIPASYGFKMCEACRDRYRGYGTKKRAKWKAEREALDQELQDLRLAEEDRRKQDGLPPLSDSPEELRAWELSIMNEKIFMSSMFAAPVALHSPYSTMTGSVQNLTAYSVESSSSPSETPSAVPPESPPAIAFPARMCTVSHCHTVLPGHYMFKRCEQHRLQNRYHSRLKRVREKVIKAAGPGSIEDANLGDSTPLQDQDCDTQTSIDGAHTQTVNEEEHMPSVDGYQPKPQVIRCNGQGCDNIIESPAQGRLCEICLGSIRSADQVGTEHAQQSPSSGEPQVNANEESDGCTFFNDYNQQDNHETISIRDFRAPYDYAEQSISSDVVPKPTLTRNESSERIHFDPSKKQQPSQADFLPTSSTSETELRITTMARMSANPTALAVSGSFAFIPMPTGNQQHAKSSIAPLAISSVTASLQPMTSSVHESTSSSTHSSIANTTPQTPHQNESQQAQTQTAASLVPYPYAFLPHPSQSQYPYPYYLPAPYGYAMPVVAGTGNTVPAVTYAPPHIYPYPCVYPSYAYPLPPPHPSANPASSRCEVALKPQRKSSATYAASSENHDTVLSRSADDHESPHLPGKARSDNKVGVVFNHYQPDAVKRKRRKVLNLSAEQIQEMRTKIQQGKLSQATNNQSSLERQTSQDSSQGDGTTVTPAADVMANARPCANRNCRRKIPNDITGMLCEKCRKKHQAKTKMLKQRLKLEPKRPIVATIKSRGQG